jgi:lipopolysaccharide/colanic/teichoic acid biosynthesis glycosyltransferase
MALPFWFIIVIIIGPMIYFQDKGSIFYNAPRLGKDGKIFKMYKFRSMKMNAPDVRNNDGSTFNAEDDPRLTKIGKFIRKTSIDETPQLLNVIKGDMSIIGPRPTISTKDFSEIKGIRRKRYEVRPGITGYTQAYFRNSISQEKKFEYDALYVDKLSAKLDIQVFLKTIKTVLFREHIFVGNADQDSNLNRNKKVKL